MIHTLVMFGTLITDNMKWKVQGIVIIRKIILIWLLNKLATPIQHTLYKQVTDF